MNFIIMGAPGCGKGTQSKKICEKYNVLQISTGDILRMNVKNGTELGVEAKGYMDSGNLVPDQLINDMVRDRLKQSDCDSGVLLDGYPRTKEQAVELDKILTDLNKEIRCVIDIDVSDEIVIERITGRRVCPSCGASFHLQFIKPKKEGICDSCGTELVQRKDDNLDSVKNRLEVYRENAKPIQEFYSDKKLLNSVDGSVSSNQVFDHIVKMIDLKD